MKLRSLRALALAATTLAVVGVSARAQVNAWPFYVARSTPAGAPHSWQAVGPLAFAEPAADAQTASGLRPLWVTFRHANGDLAASHFLYPLLSNRRHALGSSWSALNLIRYETAAPSPTGATAVRHTEIWPFYFSRQTGEPATSYRAVFPLAGRLPRKLGQDEFSFALFPLYGRFEKNGVTTTTTPWPFIKTLRGEGNRGFEFWPLAGHRDKPGVYRESFVLWPFIQHTTTGLDRPEGPTTHAHYLPFYAVDRAPGYTSETWLWPFFGYVDRTAPCTYRANNYFWPFFVQGRGDQRHVNRWAPFYTHSNIKDYDKTWVMWPLWRDATWPSDNLVHHRRQLAIFLYHDTVQRSATHPALAPARKTHLWPLYTAWDNGAGRRQIQALSPFEVFFPHNEIIRRTWSPLFSLYRYDQARPGHTRHSLLWNGITLERSAASATEPAAAPTTDFHLGPFLQVSSSSGSGQRVSFLSGLFGLHRAPDQRIWRLFTGSAASSAAPAAPSPSSP